MENGGYASVYGEYLLNGQERIWVGMPGTGKQMSLTWHNGERLIFANRKACLRWLLSACPDYEIYKTDGGISVCGGTVRQLCEEAGIQPLKRKSKPPISVAA